MLDADKIVKKIEDEKEDRTKCIFVFQLSMTTKEKILFRKGIKALINDVNSNLADELDEQVDETLGDVS